MIHCRLLIMLRCRQQRRQSKGHLNPKNKINMEAFKFLRSRFGIFSCVAFHVKHHLSFKKESLSFPEETNDWVERGCEDERSSI